VSDLGIDIGIVNTAPVRSLERFLVFGAPHIEEPEIAEVVDVLRSGWIGTGRRVAVFEEQFAEYIGSPQAVAVASCTAALHLALLALGIGPGDEVVTSALTFCATVNVIEHVGATPVVADVDPATMNIDPAAVEKLITPRTRAVLPVHFAGRPCEMDSLMDIAKRADLLMVEDCAHAIETEWNGRKAGTFGDAGCFSFYATKNVTTAEGGMLISSRSDVAEAVKVNALHGMTKDAWRRFSDEGYRHYEVVSAGFKYNMTDLQAALGIHQLARVDRNWERRREIWNAYQKSLGGLPLTLPAEPREGTRHAFHLYTIRVNEERSGVSRDEFLERMTREGIGVGVHYVSLPDHPYYRRRFGWSPDDYPNATQIGRETVSLPLAAGLTDADVADVIEGVRRSLGLRRNR
jgi:dTDP-4-amino-4,6-dideoxygalactose transaminase